MIPLYRCGCFAVLHPAAPAPLTGHPGAGRRAAVICGTLSDEALHAYRPLVTLAEQLAAAGISVLRVAYRGTGDSAGSDDEPGRFAQWLDSIAVAISLLNQDYGATAVTLIGHRLGASLAARAAGDCAAVDSLVLLNPISGRQFLHELTLAARISQRVWGTDWKLDDGVWFESHGLRIDHATRDALQTLDIRTMSARPADHVLWLEAQQRQAVAAPVMALQRLGAQVACAIHPELEWMQRDSHQAAAPAAAFDAVLRWMQDLPAPVAIAPRGEPAAATALDIGCGHETPVQFGPASALFGVFTAPDAVAAGAPALLVVNTSANPRWGNARIAVDIARGLAAEGIAALRMDASGMGDAAVPTGPVGRPYAEATTQDVLHAVDALARRTQRPVVILGICSGAYHALQAAARDARVGGVVLVNLQRFAWREGDPPDAVRRTDLRPTAFYLRNILAPQAWYRLLRAEFDVVRLIRVLLLRALRRAVASIDPLLSRLLGGMTAVGQVRQMMRTLGRRNVRVLYVLGCNDPGIEELAAYFGRDGWRLRRQPNVTVQMLAGADHTLSAAPVRATLLGCVRDWCRAGWAPAQPARPDRPDGDRPGEAGRGSAVPATAELHPT